MMSECCRLSLKNPAGTFGIKIQLQRVIRSLYTTVHLITLIIMKFASERKKTFEAPKMARELDHTGKEI